MHVCMYVCLSGASRSTPPHKSQKIELSFKYWTFSVRNWTQSWDDDLWSQTYIHDLRHTYRQTYIHDLTPQTYIHTWLSGASRSTPPHKSEKIELSFKYWTVFVRNRTHPLDDNLSSQTYIHTELLEACLSMYVYLRPSSMYVCMSQVAKHVCMYVCLRRHTYIRA